MSGRAGSPLKVEMWATARVKPYPANAKLHSEDAVEKLASIIRRYGFRVPIVVDVKGIILKGHRTWRAAQRLTLRKVPVHVARGLSAAEARAWRLADNRLALDTTSDEELTRQELEALQAGGFDLTLTGFEAEELSAFLQVPGGTGGPDEVPDPPKKPITRAGDVILLGEHRLLCGDATRAEHWGALMGRAKAEMLWTDPPYGVSYVGKTKAALTIRNDNLSDDKLGKVLGGALGLAAAQCRAGAAWYVAAPAGPTFLVFAQILSDLGVWRQTLAWVKDSFVLGRSDYHYRHESIFYGWKEGAPHSFVDDRTQDTVWEVPRPTANKEHPTMKPVELVARAIRNSSKPGSLVVDPFGGSGTTVMAAEQECRRANVMEIDPRYADVIVTRWEQLTGAKAKRPSRRSPAHGAA